jgi:hypothetical protein
MDGLHLVYATAQPIARIAGEQGPVWFFFAPKGMTPRYQFEGAALCTPPAGETSSFTLHNTAGETITIVTLTREDSLDFYRIERDGQAICFLSDAALLWDGETLKLETEQASATVCAYPASAAAMLAPIGEAVGEVKPAKRGMFRGFTVLLKPDMAEPTLLATKQVGASRYTAEIPPAALIDHKCVLLKVDYYGDIGHVFIDGEMINDNFANGDTWVTRLDSYAERLKAHPLTLLITPIKENVKIHVDSPMAARLDASDGLKAGLLTVALQPVNELILRW